MTANPKEIWFNKAVGIRMRKLRKDKNLSQGKVAEMMNVTFQQIQKYEKGANGLSLRRAEQFVKAFNLSVPYLTHQIEKDIEYLQLTAALDDSVNVKEVIDVERS